MKTEEILTDFSRNVKMVIPGLDLLPITGSHDENGIKTIDWGLFQIPPFNHRLANTPYFYEKKEVVHFTSIEVLKSIISNKSIWLYNINNLEDPREFTFAAKYLRIAHNRIGHARKYFHIMSFAEKSILSRARKS